MTTNELAIIAPRNIEEADTLSKRLAVAMVAVPEALRNKPSDVMAIIMRGAELGFPPMTALAAFQIIKGRVTLSSEAMAALVRRNRDVCEYLTIKETTSHHCIVITKRKGDPIETTFSFTMEDAKAAGLLSNDNWKRFPAAMLRARALSGVCKAVYSDLVLGLYDPEEIENSPLPQTIQPPPPPQAPAPVIVEGTVVPAKATPPRKLQIPADAPAPAPAPTAETPADPEQAKWDKLIDLIRGAQSAAALVEIKQAHGPSLKWPVPVRAEYGIRDQQISKGG